MRKALAKPAKASIPDTPLQDFSDYSSLIVLEVDSMSSHPFMQVDAFTTTPLGGNPCAIIFDADDLSDETRLAIAREMNLSETSFVIRSDVADFGARYFTPAEEIPLASHPTIATVFALIDTGRLKMTGDFFSPHLFCLCGVTDQGCTFARHFGTPPDLLEDPFTGSATGGMGAYLWHHGLLERPTFVAEQGHWMRRPGLAQVEVVGPRDDIETVKVGGSAVTVLRGELSLS